MIIRIYTLLISANDIESRWTKRSTKHRERLLEFVKVLKTNPSRTTKIGTYHVCLENEFKIGEGSDGTKVYVGLSNDGYEVAIKRIDLERCNEQLGDIEKKVLNFPKVRKEKHIVNYRFHKVDVNCKTVYLVFDLHELNLRDYVKKLSADEIIKQGPEMIRQILCGVKTLHCSHPEILHRDLKPSNVLVNMDREMVLADFGISRALPEEQTTYKSGVTGTPGWMAVESLPNNDDEEDADIQVRYKKQSDIQVVGMLSYFILSKGKHPYGNRFDRHHNLSKGEFDLKDLSDACAKDLITWMLQHDPTKRPDVDECLKHPYLRKAEENFNLVSGVGNIGEIKKNDAASAVVQKLNKLSHFTNWSLRIDPCVMAYMTRHRSYGNDTTDLLRFIRNMTEHWGDKTPPSNVQSAVVKPQEYFQKIFPTLAVDLHRIIREDSTWITKENLQEYF